MFVPTIAPPLLHTAIELKRPDDDKIYAMFQDPFAQHLLLSMARSNDCMYVGRGPKRSVPRLHTTRLKGHIESVAWNLQDQSEQTTGAILLGMSYGEGLEVGGELW